ncbi:hypothetical protein PHMEG_00013876 [Phytophthora megakarya]|uniref:CCHC-type domain-containing protein n=1 Tax=Phytophthora megakarya TaxID=4795 RepID=A0A225W5A0_9STRA|nr:hypothetical protein PHMEG_00013876 [Phytophthora megakarya]
MDEVIKVVTFMKGLKDGPVKTYRFRTYPDTLQVTITVAMQEDLFSLRQTILHTSVSHPHRTAVKTEGLEQMDLSYACAVGQRNSMRCFRCRNKCHYARECTVQAKIDVAIPDIITGSVGARHNTAIAVTRVYSGYAVLRTATPIERESYCKVQDDKPNLVIL